MSRPTRMGGKAGRAVGDKTGMLTRRPSAATLVAIIVTLAIGTQASITAQAAPSRTTSSTRSSDYRAPQRVRVVGVTDAETSSVAVAWSRSRDNVGVAGYGVYLDGARRATTPETRFALQALACGTGYIVGVDAFDAAGNRSSRTSTTVSTDACADLTPPSAPIGMQRLAATETSVVLAWTPSDDDVGVVEYGLYVSGLRVGTVTEASATVSNLECGKTYSLGIDAADAAGNHSTRSDAFFATAACVDKTPPSAPAGLAVTDATQSAIQVKWNASTDNVGVTGYGRYVASSRIGTSTTTNASFGSLKCGTTYTFGIDATDAAGNRSSTSTMIAATDPCTQTPPPATQPPPPATTGDTTPPSAPPNLGVASATQTQIVIRWDPATDIIGVVNYRIYRNGTQIGQGPGTSGGLLDEWTDPGRTCGTSYQYAVEAQDAAGNTGPRRTSPPRPARAGDSDGTQAPPPATQAPPPARGLRHRPRARHRPRRLRHRPADSAPPRRRRHRSSGDTTPPSAPPNLRVASATQTQIGIRWDAATDNVGVVNYRIYRNGTDRPGSGTSGLQWVDRLGPNLRHHLPVRRRGAGRRRQHRPKATTTATAPCSVVDNGARRRPPTSRPRRAPGRASLSPGPARRTTSVAGYGLYRNGGPRRNAVGNDRDRQRAHVRDELHARRGRL